MNPSGDEPPDHWLAFTGAGAAARREDAAIGNPQVRALPLQGSLCLR